MKKYCILLVAIVCVGCSTFRKVETPVVVTEVHRDTLMQTRYVSRVDTVLRLDSIVVTAAGVDRWHYSTSIKYVESVDTIYIARTDTIPKIAIQTEIETVTKRDWVYKLYGCGFWLLVGVAALLLIKRKLWT